jgi:putative transposase
MLRITLTAEERAAVARKQHAPTTPVLLRARCQMVVLAADGWSAPRIARHLGFHPPTVRAVLRRMQTRGLDGLAATRPSPAPDRPGRAAAAAALGRLLDEERTWTAAQLAAALTAAGTPLTLRQTRRHLGRMRARWRRTSRSLDHKQDPARVATATQTLGALKGGQPLTASRSSTSTNAASAPANP